MAIANYTKTCAKNVPGVSDLFWTEVANITTITVTADEVAGVTMGTSDKFHEVQADLDTVEYRSEGKGSNSYFTNHIIEMGFSQLSKSLFTLKETLVDGLPCGLVAIYVDGNGQPFLVGWNDTDKDIRNLDTIEDNFKTGKKPSDEDGNLFTITISGESGYDIIPFDATLTTSILAESTAASAFIEFN